MTLIILHMEHTKETKGTHVYSAGKESSIPSLYIRKTAFLSGEPAPKAIKVTIDREV